MSAVRTSFVEGEHPYTREPVPWRIDAGTEAFSQISKESRRGWRLFHYISVGGMSFGRTVTQEVVARRQRRFLVVACILFGLWLVFYFV